MFRSSCVTPSAREVFTVPRKAMVRMSANGSRSTPAINLTHVFGTVASRIARFRGAGGRFSRVSSNSAIRREREDDSESRSRDEAVAVAERTRLFRGEDRFAWFAPVPLEEGRGTLVGRGAF
jgi:hypothetical protein